MLLLTSNVPLSPKGERVRSKIELLKYIGNIVDLTNFDFKTGKFLDGEPSKKGMKVRKQFENMFQYKAGQKIWKQTINKNLTASLLTFNMLKINDFFFLKIFN